MSKEFKKSRIRELKNSTGRGGITGGRRNYCFGADGDFPVLFHGLADVCFADEIDRLRGRRGSWARRRGLRLHATGSGQSAIAAGTLGTAALSEELVDHIGRDIRDDARLHGRGRGANGGRNT